MSVFLTRISVGILLSAATVTASAQTVCRGSVDSIQTRAGAAPNAIFNPQPYIDSTGNLLLLRTSFSSGQHFVLCSLSHPLYTGENVSVELPANIEGFPPSFGESVAEQASRINLSPQVCEHWKASAQLAMVMDYQITLEYGEEQLSDCADLQIDNRALPLRLSLEK